jgi:hypothetical protein
VHPTQQNGCTCATTTLTGNAIATVLQERRLHVKVVDVYNLPQISANSSKQEIMAALVAEAQRRP